MGEEALLEGGDKLQDDRVIDLIELRLQWGVDCVREPLTDPPEFFPIEKGLITVSIVIDADLLYAHFLRVAFVCLERLLVLGHMKVPFLILAMVRLFDFLDLSRLKNGLHKAVAMIVSWSFL